MNQNFTPINHLLTPQPQPQLQVQGRYGGPEKIEIADPDFNKENVVHEVVEHVPASEVKEYVEVRKETIKVPQELKDAGVTAVSNPQFANYKPIVLPLSDERIEQGRHAPINSSLRWLSELCLYILRLAHQTIKIIHGKIVRVVVK